MSYSGEIAALFTAVCWASNSVLFALAGHRVGSRAVNLLRLWMAVAAMVLLHLVLFGTLVPLGAGLRPWAWMGTSGLIGFALGDALLFESLVLLGPRLAMLLMTLAPIFSAVLAWAFMGQSLGIPRILAILVTLGGIAWVVAEARTAGDEGRHPHRLLGVLLGVGGAMGQAVGMICSGFGLARGLSPISGNVIRTLAAAGALTLWFALRGSLGGVVGRLDDRRAVILIAAGAATGPVIGVLASLYAILHAPMGVATTLMSLSPVILLPVSAFFYHERVSPQAILGTLLSIAGAAALFLV
jgi:drug/metabolite transporter (DMT)-like permease